MTHELKIWPEFYRLVASGEKTFELRKDDRDFNPGDFIQLREWDPDTGQYTSHHARLRITHVLRDAPQFGLMPGYAVLSLAR